METAGEITRRLKRIARDARAAEAELAYGLAEVRRRRLYEKLGYARVQDYAEAELDIPRGKAKELADLAARIDRLPRTAAAFRAGDVTWTKARQVARIATPADEESWLAKAATLTSRGLEREIARAKGEPVKVVVVLEMTPEQAADFDQAIRSVREARRADVPLGEAAAEVARRALGPALDRPGYQIAIRECPKCEAASRVVGRDQPEVPVPPAELAAAKLDAVVIDTRSVQPKAAEAGSARRTRRRPLAPSVRRLVHAREESRCRLCGVSGWLQIHHLRPPSNAPADLCLLCSVCHRRLVHGGHVRLEGRAPALTVVRPERVA